MNQFVMTEKERDIVSKCMTILEFEKQPIRSTLLDSWLKEVEGKPIMTMRDIPKSLHNDGDVILISGKDY